MNAPPASRAARCWPWALCVFALLSVLLTWPAVLRPGRLLSQRPDYLVFAWNSWWFRTALFEHGQSPWWTDALHFPAGLSLAAHALSPVNAAAGGLLSFGLGLADVSRVLILLHLVLSAWAMYALARDLRCSPAAAVIAGAIWSFNPFHFHYLAELNQFTLEFLPLACLFLLRVQRDGGWRSSAALAVMFGLLAASCEYYTAYAALLAALVGLGAPLWSPTGLLTGLRRLVLAGALAAAVVACVSWPLLHFVARGGLRTEAPATQSADAQLAAVNAASNDLYGFNWRVGGEESVTLSWPSLFGYGTLLLLLAGGRSVIRQRFWLLVFASFLVLGFGPELHVGGRGTGVPLPYAALERVPGLGTLLRKPDRFVAVAQLALAVLCAFAADDLGARLQRPALRRLALGGALATILLELSVVPLGTFAPPACGYAAALRDLPPQTAVLELPNLGGTGASAVYSWAQTQHGKRITDGDVTDHALTQVQLDQAAGWHRTEAALAHGDAEPLLRDMARDGIDVVVLHTQARRPRKDLPLEGRTLWAPFFLVRRELMGQRQAEPFDIVHMPPSLLTVERGALAARLGAPIYEDEEALVFRRA